MNVMTSATKLLIAKKHNEYRTLRSKIFFKDSDNKFNSYFLETIGSTSEDHILRYIERQKDHQL